jgi:hypothetical protein
MTSYPCKYLILIWVIMTGTLSNLVGQSVTVSTDVSIRNNLSYDVFPNMEEHVILYHEQAQEHSFEIFDEQLRFKQTVTHEYEKRNVAPIGVIGYNNRVSFYYTYRDTGYVHHKVIRYDKNAAAVDTTLLWLKQRKAVEGNPRFAFSEDRSKVLIFTPIDKMLHLLLIDQQSMTILQDATLAIAGIDLRDDFDKILVTNSGKIFMLCLKAGFWNVKDDEFFYIINAADPSQASVHRLTTDDPKLKIHRIKMGYDERNDKITVGGLVGEGDEMSSSGYFACGYKPNQMPAELSVSYHKYSPEFMSDITGKKVGRVREVPNFRVRDLLSRNDGGLILITEVVREYTRRASTVSPGNFADPISMRGGMTDYYHEDVMVFTTGPSGQEQWYKQLFKKQFSQDDDGIFSSYFLFKTPSRLKLIYNDEIKNANTVSSYEVDPLGRFQRTSVLSTEYQSLKLRFRDAIQIGAKSLIVPSEKNWKVNLVRIDY